MNEIQGQDDVAAPPAPPDLFAAFEALVSLVADPQRHAAEVETLKRRLASATAASARSAADRARFDRYEKAVRDRHAREHDELISRNGASIRKMRRSMCWPRNTPS